MFKTVVFLAAAFLMPCRNSCGQPWPEFFQGAWELKIDWQTSDDGQRRDLSNNRTTYQVLVEGNELFLYHKTLHSLTAYRLLATTNRDDDRFVGLTKCGEKSQLIEFTPTEIVFWAHGRFPRTGFKMTRLVVVDQKELFRNVLEKHALLVENKFLRFRGEDVKQFDQELEYPGNRLGLRFQIAQLRVPAEGEVLWFNGEKSMEPRLRELVGAKF